MMKVLTVRTYIFDIGIIYNSLTEEFFDGLVEFLENFNFI